MTPTATYIAEENCLQEESRVEKPRKPNPYTDSIDAISLQRYKSEVAEYDRRMAEYTRHLATLRKIPCEPEPVFKDGEKYTEGVDYEIKGAGDWKWCYELKGKIFASPLVPVKSEDEDALWRDVYAEAEAAIDWQYQEMNDKKLIAILKSKYIITKR